MCSVASMAPLPKSSTNGTRFLRAKRRQFRGCRRFDETAHEEIAAMHFQKQRRLFADGAGVIGERCLVGRADFAKLRAARFQDFADAKTAADLDEFAARDDDFVFVRSHEMANDQHQRRRTIVHDRRGFGLAKNGESPLEISAAVTAFSSLKIELYIIISGGDISKDFARALGKWRPAKIGVDD